jgi:hypothetical protein
MMENLVKAFFERDLTEAEEKRLDTLLESSPKEAFQLLERAKALYLQTGLPNPEPPPAGGPPLSAGGAKMLWGFLTGIVITGAAWWSWENRPVPQPEVSIPVSAIPLAAPAYPKITPAGSPPRPEPPPAGLKQVFVEPEMVRPEPYIAGHRYGGLNVIVDQKGSGLITIRVLDPNGKEIRLLFANILEAGRWNFSWDGRTKDGRLAKAGLYQVETQSGKTLLRKEIRIVREPAP